ncbi:MAG: helix-hairpin-helix domain-containing protein [Xanthomonadaceae bacterium]|nr:helix-hairpin-helix domain-containing protein [Xanthomonadaceae bacterium]MDP2184852.1 helix-hairpin-helix domain-containing protein [Xanthomonadales bacterium]MDZ4116064.1 helix-hairpin-helix domain-containing protein [Xanthomonadaceae bacterium]MDZ4376795.1 helix-hairpin-helix domain-containing protein [Xanthomonadaceae bacterium]
MHPDKVDRERVVQLTDLPNVGKATADDLLLLGIRTPAQLLGQCPLALYHRLSRITGQRQDPCVIDVFMSITGFINGDPPQPWWYYTEARKRMLAEAHAQGVNVEDSPS